MLYLNKYSSLPFTHRTEIVDNKIEEMRELKEVAKNMNLN